MTETGALERVIEGIRFVRATAGGAGRNLARPVRGAAGRRHRAAAGLCPRHPACGTDGAGRAAQRAGGGAALVALSLGRRPLETQHGREDVRGRRDLRRRDHRVRRFDQLLSFAGGAVRARRFRHGERVHPLGADPVRHAGRDARPRERGQHAVHRRFQRTGRIRNPA